MGEGGEREMAKRADYDKAERAARGVIWEMAVLEPPTPIVKIVEAYKFGICEMNLAIKFKDVSGYIDFDAQTIVLNQADPPTRKAFTLAHELGHRRMHWPQLEEDHARSVVYWRSFGAGDPPDPLEQEANCFAANLLVPEAFLLRYREQPRDVIAKIFGVSPEVIEYRFRDIARRWGVANAGR
jgi:Zn-dependent peptidase ImmA (M78 family)